MNNNIMQQFQQFMQMMKGKDPDSVLQELINSGKINQDQLNQAQQQANQMKNKFDGFKSFFGF